jgi:hypothetical protein
MKIKKAKLKNRSLEIEFKETKGFINAEGEAIESTREVSLKSYDLCTDDLINAFNKLKPHAALIADIRDAITVERLLTDSHINEIDLEQLKDIDITGFVVCGSDEDGSAGAMIIFSKTTGNRTIYINTPIVKFEDGDSYFYCNQLSNVIDECVAEVEEYLNGKVAVKQLEMQFDEGFDAEVTISGAEPKPKKRGRKAKAFEGFNSHVDENGTIVLTPEVA